MDCHFLFAVIEGLEPWNVAASLNYLTNETPFEPTQVLNGIRIVQQSQLAIHNKGGAQAAPCYYVYAVSEPEEFKEFYGFEYDEQRLPELPNLTIAKMQKDREKKEIEKLTAQQGGDNVNV